MNAYIENPKTHTKELLIWLRVFSKIVSWGLQIQFSTIRNTYTKFKNYIKLHKKHKQLEIISQKTWKNSTLITIILC